MDLIKNKELGLSDIEDELDSQGIRILVRNNYVPKNYFNCHDVDDFDEIIPIVNVEFYGELKGTGTAFVYLEPDKDDLEKIATYGDPEQIGNYSDPVYTFEMIGGALYPVAPNCEIYRLTDEEFENYLVEWPNPEKSLENIDKCNFDEEYEQE